MDYQTKEDLEKELADFKILFAYNSNKIENEQTDYHDTREVFENGRVTGFSGDPRTLFEIQNQKNCWSFLMDRLALHEPMSSGLIREVHRLLTAGTYDQVQYAKGERPGEYKKGDYVIGISETGSAPEDVGADMEDLLKEINETDHDDCLLIAAYFHLRFKSIHPFADGNGRTGRTMLNYYLILNHKRPLIVYEEDKKLYYECLRKYDEEEDIRLMMQFLEYAQEKTWTRKQKTHAKLSSFLLSCSKSLPD